MLRMQMFSLVGFGWRINADAAAADLVVVTSLKFSLMLGVGCSRLAVIGILLRWICIDS